MPDRKHTLNPVRWWRFLFLKSGLSLLPPWQLVLWQVQKNGLRRELVMMPRVVWRVWRVRWAIAGGVLREEFMLPLNKQ